MEARAVQMEAAHPARGEIVERSREALHGDALEPPPHLEQCRRLAAPLAQLDARRGSVAGVVQLEIERQRHCATNPVGLRHDDHSSPKTSSPNSSNWLSASAIAFS